ncbi:MAG TPA: response regulator [Ktedonobacteraceae bacterium]|nr:response regulator [Ktedonobacteraceae bacterium]
MSFTILVIDDDDALLDLFRLLLDEEGYAVVTSKTAFEDVSEVERINPHLIILDIMMGRHYEGLLLLEKLRLYPPTRSLPVILCTAAANVIREQEETLQQKGVPILYKPFELEELLQVIHSLLPGTGEKAEGGQENSGSDKGKVR